jgi:hypothetical protein
MKPTVSDNDSASTLLARFPGPIRLYPSRRKWLLILAIGAGFLIIGLLMLRDPAAFADRRYSATEILVVSWLCVLFFGLGVILAAINLIPGASSLTLDSSGFVVRNLYRTTSQRWADVDNFAAVEVPAGPRTKRLVGYDSAQRAGNPVGRLNVAVSGRNSGLPDSYGLSEADLANLMTQWRSRALAQP